MPLIHQDRYIVCVVSYTFEEDPSSQQANLKGRDVDVGAIFVPRPGSNAVCYHRRKQSIEVEEEEEGENATDEDLNEEDPIECSRRDQRLDSESVVAAVHDCYQSTFLAACTSCCSNCIYLLSSEFTGIQSSSCARVVVYIQFMTRDHVRMWTKVELVREPKPTSVDKLFGFHQSICLTSGPTSLLLRHDLRTPTNK